MLSIYFQVLHLSLFHIGCICFPTVQTKIIIFKQNPLYSLKIKPASFSINLFITHLFETFRLVSLAKIYLLDDDIEEFFAKVSNSLGVEYPEKDCILAIKDFLAGKV